MYYYISALCGISVIVIFILMLEKALNKRQSNFISELTGIDVLRQDINKRNKRVQEMLDKLSEKEETNNGKQQGKHL